MQDIKELDWLEIFLGYKCNYKCLFCFENKLRFHEKTNIVEDTMKLITDWYNLWKKFIIFSWGEPTLYKDLYLYVTFSKKIWYEKILIHTNWTQTCNFDYLLKLHKSRLTGIIFSYHWYW